MKYKMIALDIDGTLTNSKKQITPGVKRALKKAQEKGVKVVLASGRPTPGILPLAKELELENYGGFILSFNGGKIINCKTGETIYEKMIPEEKISALYDFARKHDVGLLSYQKDHIITESPENKYVKIEARVNQMPVKEIEDFVDYVDFPVVKCMMLGDGEYLEKLEEKAVNELGDGLSIYRSEPYFLETMPENIDKANSLEKLLRHEGLTREELIACGDGFNDVSMIHYAGLGVAMENAQEAVKQVANYVTASCDEDGVAKVVEKFLS